LVKFTKPFFALYIFNFFIYVKIYYICDDPSAIGSKTNQDGKSDMNDHLPNTIVLGWYRFYDAKPNLVLAWSSTLIISNWYINCKIWEWTI